MVWSKSKHKKLQDLLEKTPNVTIIGEANNGQEALTLIENLSPDILLLDISMPVMDGLTAIKILKQRGYKVPIIILSGNNDIETVAESMEYGAHSYLLKEDAPTSILEAINKAYRGEVGSISFGVSKNKKLL